MCVTSKVRKDPRGKCRYNPYLLKEKKNYMYMYYLITLWDVLVYTLIILKLTLTGISTSLTPFFKRTLPTQLKWWQSSNCAIARLVL